MTDNVTPEAPADRNWRGAFFWYVNFQLLTMAAIYLFAFAWGGAVLIGIADPARFLDFCTFLETGAPMGLNVVCLLACIAIASQHSTGFWGGVGLWFAGNFSSLILALPLIGLTIAATDWMEHGAAPGAMFLMLSAAAAAYALACGYFIRRRRRKAQAATVQRAMVESF